MLDNKIALNYILEKQTNKQKDICIVANSFCYLYINTPAETQINRIIQKATRLQNVHKEDPL